MTCFGAKLTLNFSPLAFHLFPTQHNAASLLVPLLLSRSVLSRRVLEQRGYPLLRSHHPLGDS